MPIGRIRLFTNAHWGASSHLRTTGCHGPSRGPVYSIVTHPRVYDPPTPIDIALDQIDIWLESPSLTLLGESEIHWPELRGQIAQGRIAGPQVHDARIATLCLQHGVKKLWTADRDFGRFPQLACANPLVGDETRR